MYYEASVTGEAYGSLRNKIGIVDAIHNLLVIDKKTDRKARLGNAPSCLFFYLFLPLPLPLVKNGCCSL